MEKKYSYILSLKKIANDALEKTDIDLTDDLISNIKTILFFIGKVVLSIKYLKETKGISSDNINIELIEDTYSQFLSVKFDENDKLFMDDVFLKDEHKQDIIKIVKDISNEQLTEFSLGKLYENFITNKQRKLLGQVYTPEYIVKFMISSSISIESIINNPYFSVLDPACGGGYFLIEAYNRIKQIFEENYSLIVNSNPEIVSELEKGIHAFILRNNIHGFDIDSFAVYMTKISLLLKGSIDNSTETNIYCKDILVEGNKNLIDILDDMVFKKDIEGIINKYDLVIGNPPYIGHKSVDKDYRKKLQDYYCDVYSDKSDISYCFFKKGYELLKDNGRLIFITSRYFLEAPSARGLRGYMKNNFTIEEIVDFYGESIFKGVGISPVILNCTKNHYHNKDFIMYRRKRIKSALKLDFDLDNDFKKYYVSQDGLDDNGWLLISENERKLFNKICALGTYILDEVCICNQGVITGCDKAFIVEAETIENEKLELNILKPWIKNSEVRKYRNTNSKRFVLYTDLIEDPAEFVNAINHISPFKEKLESRRECLNGVRQWYQLQWGRNSSIFKQPKIIFPFKASANEFTIAYDEVCCSADVYILNVRDIYRKELSLEYLVAFMNSSLFEFYFKSVAKKLNEGMYEYYPNKLMSLKIKLGTNKEVVENKVKKVMSNYNIFSQISIAGEKKKSDKDIDQLRKEIDIELSHINDYFYNLYNLDSKEIKIIEENI